MTDLSDTVPSVSTDTPRNQLNGGDNLEIPAPVRQLNDGLAQPWAKNDQLRESAQTIQLLERYIANCAREAIRHKDSERHPSCLRPVR